MKISVLRMQWLNLDQSKQPEQRNTFYMHALAVASNIAITIMVKQTIQLAICLAISLNIYVPHGCVFEFEFEFEFE